MRKSFRALLLGCAASLAVYGMHPACAATDVANGQIIPPRTDAPPPAPSGTPFGQIKTCQ